MAKERDSVSFKPWSELKSLQNRKLHLFITRHLYPFSPFYRRLFDKNKITPDSIKKIEDLQRIPFTSKDDFLGGPGEDIVDRNLEFLLRPDEALIKTYLPKSELIKFIFSNLTKGKDYTKGRLEKEYMPIFLTATAGTTNKPVTFLYTSYDIDNLKTHGTRIVEIMGVKSSGRIINTFPYAPHLAFWQTVFAGLAANIFILSTGGGKTLGTEGNILSLLKIKPEFLIGEPNYIYHILKTAREKGCNFSFLKSIALGAAPIPKGFKRKLADILFEMGSAEIKVFGTYGFTEARAAWVECPTSIDVSSGYHTYPDKGIIEIVDPLTGEMKAEGEDGELVYTDIDARGTCVLRYRTGDLVKGGITYSPCPYCGRTVPRISSDITRASNIKDIMLSKIKGTLVNLNELERLLSDAPEIDDWQIEISKKNDDPYEIDQLVLYVSLLKDVDKTTFAVRLNQAAASKTEVSFNQIYFISKEELRRRIEVETAIKAKKIIDRRPKI